MVAKKVFMPGDVLFSETPIVSSVSISSHSMVCATRTLLIHKPNCHVHNRHQHTRVRTHSLTLVCAHAKCTHTQQTIINLFIVFIKKQDNTCSHCMMTYLQENDLNPDWVHAYNYIYSKVCVCMCACVCREDRNS